MKKIPLLMAVMMLHAGQASAAILPARGMDERGGTPAVSLTETLTVLDERGDQGGRMVDTLPYTGEAVSVLEAWDGYARIVYGKADQTGWVARGGLLMDPAWYVCDEDMKVYACPDVMAPCVALLDQGMTLPVITEYDDGESIGGWVCVSLGGGTGWIRKTPADTADQTWFRPAMLENIARAELHLGDKEAECTDSARLAELAKLLTSAEDYGAMVAGCPFTAALKLTLNDGQQISLQLAADSCCVYRVDGRDYAYARSLWSDEEGSPGNEVLFRLFDMAAPGP